MTLVFYLLLVKHVGPNYLPTSMAQRDQFNHFNSNQYLQSKRSIVPSFKHLLDSG